MVRALPLLGFLALIANVAAFAAVLAFGGDAASNPSWWLAILVMLAPTAACFARAALGGPRRAAAIWLGVGMLAWTAGGVIYVQWTQFQADPPVPSPADLCYLGFYVCVLGAIVSLVRGDHGAPSRSLWLDGALGAAGGATALAAVLSPVLSGIEGDLAEILVGASYPVADLLLVATVCGVLAARGARGGSIWFWLAGGLAIFCAADVVYALQVTSDAFVVGTVLNGLWALGLTVVVLAVWRPQRPRAVKSGRSAAILAIPMTATATAVVVLVIASFSQLPGVVVALATFTLALAAARTFVGFQQVQRLSDAHRQSITDELTGLGNRRGLFELGEQRLLSADPLALLLIDLDNFKELNDTLGHHAGDELLREVARRLAARVEGPDLLVRLGGDEFALLVGLADGEDGCEVTERILEHLTRPIVIEGVRLRVDASAGVALRGDAGLGIAELLRRADLSMYAAKAGSARVAPYDARLDDATRARLETIQDLDAALVRREFVLHYQPKIDLRSGATLGAEALVRWQHPTRGLLYPDVFLPIVEKSGLMSALTRIVLETAVQQLAGWHRAGLQISVAVNLSASDLLDEDLAGRIAELLSAHDLPVGALELELTESVLMTDPQRARKVLDELQRLGLRIAVDDYGTGYCALAYLRDLPIDELKIDRSFVAHITADPRSAAIVRSTIELAHALEMQVVAEGVEDQDALDAVRDFGCDNAQGYFFSRPLAAAAFTAWAEAAVSVPLSR